MTSTARDKVWGRQGGRWAETRDTATCLTCRNGTARWACTRQADRNSPEETWPVCTSCKAQGERLSRLLTCEPLVAS